MKKKNLKYRLEQEAFDFMLEIFYSLNKLSFKLINIVWIHFCCRMPQWTFPMTRTCVTAASHCMGDSSAAWRHSTSHWTEASLCILPLASTTLCPAGTTLWWTASPFWMEGCSSSWGLLRRTIDWMSPWPAACTSREVESSGPTISTYKVRVRG